MSSGNSSYKAWKCVESIAAKYGISNDEVVDALLQGDNTLVDATTTCCIKAKGLRSFYSDVNDIIQWFRRSEVVYMGRNSRVFVNKPTFSSVDQLNEERLLGSESQYHVTVVDTDKDVPETDIDYTKSYMAFLHKSKYHNPFPVGEPFDKKGRPTEKVRLAESIRKFREYAERKWGEGEGREELLRDLAGRTLGCYCFQPRDTKEYAKVLEANPEITDGVVCHAQVLMNMIKG